MKMQSNVVFVFCVKEWRWRERIYYFLSLWGLAYVSPCPGLRASAIDAWHVCTLYVCVSCVCRHHLHGKIWITVHRRNWRRTVEFGAQSTHNEFVQDIRFQLNELLVCSTAFNQSFTFLVLSLILSGEMIVWVGVCVFLVYLFSQMRTCSHRFLWHSSSSSSIHCSSPSSSFTVTESITNHLFIQSTQFRCRRMHTRYYFRHTHTAASSIHVETPRPNNHQQKKNGEKTTTTTTTEWSEDSQRPRPGTSFMENDLWKFNIE